MALTLLPSCHWCRTEKDVSRGNLLPFSLDTRPTPEEAEAVFSSLRIPAEAWEDLLDIAYSHPHGLTATEVAVLKANAPEDRKLVKIVETVHYKVVTNGPKAPSPGAELCKIARNFREGGEDDADYSWQWGCAARRHWLRPVTRCLVLLRLHRTGNNKTPALLPRSGVRVLCSSPF